MKQIVIKNWQEAKERHPDSLILVRYFDEYYAINEDAHKLQSCGVRVYSDTEHEGVEYASFCSNELDTILPRIIRQGNRVGIVDVLTEYKDNKG